MRKLRYLSPLLWMALIFIVSSQSFENMGAPLFPHIDKVLHMLGFGFLCASWLWASTSLRWSIVVCIVYAASDEWHQSFVMGRHASMADFMADCIGILVVGLVYRFLYNESMMKQDEMV